MVHFSCMSLENSEASLIVQQSSQNTRRLARARLPACAEFRCPSCLRHGQQVRSPPNAMHDNQISWYSSGLGYLCGALEGTNACICMNLLSLAGSLHMRHGNRILKGHFDSCFWLLLRARCFSSASQALTASCLVRLPRNTSNK